MSELVGQAIAIAGHKVTDIPEIASYSVRIVGQARMGGFTARQDIILKEPVSVETVPEDATLVNIGTLRVLGTNMSLTEWLTHAQDPLDDGL